MERGWLPFEAQSKHSEACVTGGAVSLFSSRQPSSLGASMEGSHHVLGVFSLSAETGGSGKVDCGVWGTARPRHLPVLFKRIATPARESLAKC